MPLTSRGGYDPAKDPRNNPRYKALLQRQAASQRASGAKPLSAEDQRRLAKLAAETKKWSRRQAEDLPKFQAKEKKKEERKAKLPHNRAQAALQKRLDAKDERGGKKHVSQGKAAATQANTARQCPKCLGTGKKSSLLGTIKCGACKGTGNKPQSSWL
jgi:hypothetical protein